MGASLVGLLLVVSIAWGLRYWAFRAEKDRSANVGLYLVYGIPGILLIVAGAALATNGKALGVYSLALGVGFLLPLIPSFRYLFSKVTPIDPNSPSDMSGLSVILAIIFFFVAATLLNPSPSGTDSESTTSVTYAYLIVQVLAYIGLALSVVGAGFKRVTWASIVDRLGIVRPTLWMIVISIGFLVLCCVVSLMAGVLTFLTQPDVSNEIDTALRNMTSDVQSPLGAVVLGLSAGIGEELFFRGALQPRLGIGLTALLFALLHTQYGLSFTLLGIFAIGVVLGYERKRFGTTPAIITHAVFNIIAVLARTYL